jgi:hypothetical protein
VAVAADLAEHRLAAVDSDAHRRPFGVASGEPRELALHVMTAAGSRFQRCR